MSAADFEAAMEHFRAMGKRAGWYQRARAIISPSGDGIELRISNVCTEVKARGDWPYAIQFNAMLLLSFTGLPAGTEEIFLRTDANRIWVNQSSMPCKVLQRLRRT